MKEEKTRKKINTLVNINEGTSDFLLERKHPIEEALEKSSDEVLAKAIQDMLKKDMLH
ncbi:MAG: hypothetical protein GX308_00200 [Epulopiscium sp.]|nr:hypothetical protein [Candidatus Epulonipiscium sp.]